MDRCPGLFRQILVVLLAKKRRKSVDRCPGIFASFLLAKKTGAAAVVAAAGKKSVVFEEFAYFYATVKL